jgi:hypothetical protein
MILCFFDFGLCVCKPAEFSGDVTLKLTFIVISEISFSSKHLEPVLLVNVGTVDCQRYQYCKNAEHSINCQNIDSRNIDISTVLLTFCIVVDQFFKIVNLIKINYQVIDIKKFAQLEQG